MKRRRRKVKCPYCSVTLVKTNVKGIKRCPNCKDDFRKEGNSLRCLCCNSKYPISG